MTLSIPICRFPSLGTLLDTAVDDVTSTVGSGLIIMRHDDSTWIGAWKVMKYTINACIKFCALAESKVSLRKLVEECSVQT